jgi:hypothetical protein
MNEQKNSSTDDDRRRAITRRGQPRRQSSFVGKVAGGISQNAGIRERNPDLPITRKPDTTPPGTG